MKTATTTPTLQDLQSGLTIDRDDLDSELAVQADMYYRVAEACALAASRRDEAKSTMEDELSRAASRARSAAAANDERATEAYVKEQAAKDKKFTDARNAYLRAKLEADLWSSMRDSYDAKGKMLREMAQLFIAGYFQATAVGGRRARQVGEITNEQNRAELRRASKTHG